MKNVLTLFFVLVLVVSIEAQSAGIEFAQTDWATTLAKAKEENKLIFVDCYTTWCGPCKWMSANVFPDKAVGDYYNANFINVKLDMEKGEGLDFAKKYAVRAYPTLMFIDGDGKMVHKAIGMRNTENFHSLGEAASDPDQQIAGMMAKHDAGERSPEFLKQYAEGLHSAGMPGREKVAEAYLAKQADWSSKDNMEFIFGIADYNVDSKLIGHITANRDAYAELVGADQVTGKLKGAVQSSLRQAKGASDEEVTSMFQKVFPNNYEEYKLEYQLNQWMYSDNEAELSRFINKAPEYIEKYNISNWQTLNSYAWRFYEVITHPKKLAQARTWAEKSVAIESNYYNNDTLAALCYKLKDKAAAAKHAQIAIDLAAEDGSDAADTKELLNKIKALD
ncbi:MAG: thioredoxin family protein [Bacteroidota bacterium]